jgi:lysosomal alpha-mannosidase
MALKDNSLQFTVSNDRSQGGSSLKNGRIELMQNRQTPCDDDKGVDEHLNETDANGNGIRVPATYYL